VRNCYITGGVLISFLISRSTGVSVATANKKTKLILSQCIQKAASKYLIAIVMNKMEFKVFFAYNLAQTINIIHLNQLHGHNNVDCDYHCHEFIISANVRFPTTCSCTWKI